MLTVAVDPPSCAALRDAIARGRPALAPWLSSARFAVNHEFVPDQHMVSAGDEVALIGAVSGG